MYFFKLFFFQRLVNLQRKVYIANSALQYFLTNEWKFKNEKLLKLLTDLPCTDLESFGFEYATFDIHRYFEWVHTPNDFRTLDFILFSLFLFPETAWSEPKFTCCTRTWLTCPRRKSTTTGRVKIPVSSWPDSLRYDLDKSYLPSRSYSTYETWSLLLLTTVRDSKKIDKFSFTWDSETRSLGFKEDGTFMPVTARIRLPRISNVSRVLEPRRLSS